MLVMAVKKMKNFNKMLTHMNLLISYVDDFER